MSNGIRHVWAWQSRLVKMQLIFLAGFSSHETIREGRFIALATAALVQGRELVLNGEASSGVHFVSPAPRRAPIRARSMMSTARTSICRTSGMAFHAVRSRPRIRSRRSAREQRGIEQTQSRRRLHHLGLYNLIFNAPAALAPHDRFLARSA